MTKFLDFGDKKINDFLNIIFSQNTESSTSSISRGSVIHLASFGNMQNDAFVKDLCLSLQNQGKKIGYIDTHSSFVYGHNPLKNNLTDYVRESNLKEALEACLEMYNNNDLELIVFDAIHLADKTGSEIAQTAIECKNFLDAITMLKTEKSPALILLNGAYQRPNPFLGNSIISTGGALLDFHCDVKIYTSFDKNINCTFDIVKNKHYHPEKIIISLKSDFTIDFSKTADLFSKEYGVIVEKASKKSRKGYEAELFKAVLDKKHEKNLDPFTNNKKNKNVEILESYSEVLEKF